MLRRLKTDVELTLPPKTETKVFLPMSKMQHFWYKALLSRESDALNSREGPSAGTNVWKRLQSLLMQLRKCTLPNTYSYGLYSYGSFASVRFQMHCCCNVALLLQRFIDLGTGIVQVATIRSCFRLLMMRARHPTTT